MIEIKFHPRKDDEVLTPIEVSQQHMPHGVYRTVSTNDIVLNLGNGAFVLLEEDSMGEVEPIVYDVLNSEDDSVVFGRTKLIHLPNCTYNIRVDIKDAIE